MSQHPFIPRTWARNILHAMDVCNGEGIGPDGDDVIEMIKYIATHYPEEAECYDHIPEVRECLEKPNAH